MDPRSPSNASNRPLGLAALLRLLGVAFLLQALGCHLLVVAAAFVLVRHRSLLCFVLIPWWHRRRNNAGIPARRQPLSTPRCAERPPRPRGRGGGGVGAASRARAGERGGEGCLSTRWDGGETREHIASPAGEALQDEVGG